LHVSSYALKIVTTISGNTNSSENMMSFKTSITSESKVIQMSPVAQELDLAA